MNQTNDQSGHSTYQWGLWAVRALPEGSGERTARVLFVLAMHADQEGVCWPSRPTLAVEVFNLLSRDEVTRHHLNRLRESVRKLERLGLVEVGTGSHRSNEYRLTPDRALTMALEPSGTPLAAGGPPTAGGPPVAEGQTPPAAGGPPPPTAGGSTPPATGGQTAREPKAEPPTEPPPVGGGGGSAVRPSPSGLDQGAVMVEQRVPGQGSTPNRRAEPCQVCRAMVEVGDGTYERNDRHVWQAIHTGSCHQQWRTGPTRPQQQPTPKRDEATAEYLAELRRKVRSRP